MLRMTFTCLLAVIPLVLTSCSGSTGPKGPPTPKTTKVGGVILFDGQPAPRGIVELKLYEKGHDPKPAQMIPRAIVGENGKYEFSSYGDKDGSVPGDYVISVEWLKIGPGSLFGPDKLLNNFNKPSNDDPHFQVTVIEGKPIEIPTIDINTKELKQKKAHPWASPAGKRK